MIWLQNCINLVQSRSRSGLPLPPTTQPAIHHAVEMLVPTLGVAEPEMELKPFLLQVATIDVARLRRFRLNRVLRGCWIYPDFDEFGARALDHAWRQPRRSSDAAIIDGYLLHFPLQRPIIRRLAEAARAAAMRHDWAWADRAQRWQLFDPAAGPNLIAAELLRTGATNAASLLDQTGIGYNFTACQFGIAAFDATCRKTATLDPARAPAAQAVLLGLLQQLPTLPCRSNVVRALLQPWLKAAPPREHRQQLSRLLVDKIGDPRLQKPRWDTLRQQLAAGADPALADELVRMLVRWLVDDDVRTFFHVIDQTTDRPDQWQERAEFWLAYLDAGLVQDAWPALGERARGIINQQASTTTRRSQHGRMQRSPKGSSALILQIGDTRIAEWSDNGACRFWNVTDRKAPALYRKVYHNEDVRPTTGRSDFEFRAHHGAWQSKIAGIIYRRTGIRHPHHGTGTQ